VGFADSSRFAISIPFVRITPDRTFESWWTPTEEATIIDHIRGIFSGPHARIVGQNFIYDTQYFQHWMGITPRLEWDTMLAQNVLFPGTPKDLATLASLYCRYYWYWKEDHKEWNLKGTIEDLLTYNCMDCIRTFEVAEAQTGVIAGSGLIDQMRLKLRTNSLCLRMMQRGVRFDLPKRGKLSYDLAETQAAIGRELEAIIPQDMVQPSASTPWYRSDAQTRYLFYDRLGFGIQKDRKTGQPSVGKEARKALQRNYPEFTGLFDRLRLYGSLEIAHNVVTVGLDSDGRLRCSYNPGGTETHRLSSSKNPFGRGMNLQNLSMGEED
jgi:DNA polymerase I-like protein with 3'-5' exonuclease and polymerase domains